MVKPKSTSAVPAPAVSVDRRDVGGRVAVGVQVVGRRLVLRAGAPVLQRAARSELGGQDAHLVGAVRQGGEP